MKATNSSPVHIRRGMTGLYGDRIPVGVSLRCEEERDDLVVTITDDLDSNVFTECVEAAIGELGLVPVVTDRPRPERVVHIFKVKSAEHRDTLPTVRTQLLECIEYELDVIGWILMAVVPPRRRQLNLFRG